MSHEVNEPAAASHTTVFLSYARADQHQATKLADALAAAGLVVWWDTQIEVGCMFMSRKAPA